MSYATVLLICWSLCIFKTVHVSVQNILLNALINVIHNGVVVFQVCEKLALVPGKLDHATVVAYTVGLHLDPDAPDPEEHPVVRHPVFRPAPLASPDSTRSLVSQLEEARPTDLPTVSAGGGAAQVVGSEGKESPFSQDKENRSPNTAPVPCRPTLIETVV